jgi:hypothetical protein
MLRSTLVFGALLAAIPTIALAEYPDQFLIRGQLIDCPTETCEAVSPQVAQRIMKDECDVFDLTRTPVGDYAQLHPGLLQELIRIGYAQPLPRPKPSQ